MASSLFYFLSCLMRSAWRYCVHLAKSKSIFLLLSSVECVRVCMSVCVCSGQRHLSEQEVVEKSSIVCYGRVKSREFWDSGKNCLNG